MNGFYFDPKHGGCLRRIRKVNQMTYRIDGVYGSDEIGTHGYWSACARVVRTSRTSTMLRVDFKGKPSKVDRYLSAEYKHSTRRIHWEDGNVWTKMFTHATQL